MKRVILAMLLLSASVFAQTTYYRTDAPLEWDAVTQAEVWVDIDGDGAGDTDINGDAIIELVTSVSYDVGRSVNPVADRVVPDALLVNTPLTTYVDDPVPADSNAYVYAIRTVFVTTSGVSRSAWNWSDVNGAATPVPFMWVNPGSSFSRQAPMGLRRR